MAEMIATATTGVLSKSSRERPRGASWAGTGGFGISRNKNRIEPTILRAITVR